MVQDKFALIFFGFSFFFPIFASSTIKLCTIMSVYTSKSRFLPEHLFWLFLDRRDAGLGFLVNSTLYPAERADGDFFDVTAPKEYLINAFVWADTPEGLVYWSVIDEAWRDIVSAYNL